MFEQALVFNQQLCWVLYSSVDMTNIVTGTASATVTNDGGGCTRPTLSCGPGQFDRNKGGLCRNCCSGFQFSTSCLAMGSRDTVANACQACPPVTDATANSGNGLNCQNFECSAGKYYNGMDTSPNDNTGAACVDCSTDDSTCAYNEYGEDVCQGVAQGITRMTGALTCATCTNNVPDNAVTASYGSTFGDSSSCSFQCALGDWYDSDDNLCHPNPTSMPSSEPSSQPTSEPTSQPTCQPSGQPSGEPTGRPTVKPSGVPSGEPSGQPSGLPSRNPSSAQPSSCPSVHTSAPSVSVSDEWGSLAAMMQSKSTQQLGASLFVNGRSGSIEGVSFGVELYSTVTTASVRMEAVRRTWDSFWGSNDLAIAAVLKTPAALEVRFHNATTTESSQLFVTRCTNVTVIRALLSTVRLGSSVSREYACDNATFWRATSIQSCVDGSRKTALCVGRSESDCAAYDTSLTACVDEHNGRSTDYNLGSGASFVALLDPQRPLIAHPSSNTSMFGGWAASVTVAFLNPVPAPLISVLSTTNPSSTAFDVTATFDTPTLSHSTLKCAVFPTSAIFESFVLQGVPTSDSMRTVRLPSLTSSSDGAVAWVSGMVPASSANATLTMTALVPSSSYTVICSTVTSLGVEMGAAVSLDTRVNVTMLCCRRVELDLGKSIVEKGVLEERMVVVKATHPPTLSADEDDVFVVLEVINATGNVVDVLYPSEIAIAPTNAAAGQLFPFHLDDVVFLSVFDGNFTITATLRGASAHLYSITWTDAGDGNNTTQSGAVRRDVTVTTTPPPMPAPFIRSVLFSDNGARVHMHFSTKTDRGRGSIDGTSSSESDCSGLLSFRNASSSGPVICRWASDGDVLTIENSLLLPGEHLTLLAGALRAACPDDVDGADCAIWASNVRHTMAIGLPMSPPAPNVAMKLSPSDALSGCSPLTIYTTGFTGQGGRDWTHVFLIV